MRPQYSPVWPDRAPAKKWMSIRLFVTPMKSRRSLCESRDDREVIDGSMTNHRNG